MFRSFFSARSGQFAILTAVAAVPLMLAVGLAVDYSRHSSANRHLQEVADAISLSLASGTERNEERMKEQANRFIDSNIDHGRIDAIEIAAIDATEDDVDVRLTGHIRASFMAIAGYDYLNVSASSLAMRAVTGSVEVALVLDNTWSMSETDARGATKIATLKSAAGNLVDQLMNNSKADVKIGLVPYADYVNVGVENRNEPWLDVPADIAAVASTCEYQEVTSQSCKTYQYNTCTRTVDGVPETYSCNTCIEYNDPVTKTQKVCSGGVSAQTWYGCIRSRKPGTYRLNDTAPTVPYPGFIGTSQKCLNPIIRLTDDKAKLKTAISNMIINIGTGYRPYTYIPAGLIWGVNVVSPGVPFTEGLAYDPANVTPRKAIVLMTDGENTLKFRSSDGAHVSFSSNTTTAAREFANVNKETLDICTYAKNNNIEIFTVAFMVNNSDAKTMMQSCATDADHYFDASDNEKLMAAFSGIARSLSVVRLAR